LCIAAAARQPQRCWCHKTANVLNKLPKGEQPRAKEALQQIWMAATRADALRAFHLFVKTYDANPPIPGPALRAAVDRQRANETGRD
jgi:transposase-like protein